MAHNKGIIDHYGNPRNVGSFDNSDENIGSDMVGAPACGDMMRLRVKASSEDIVEDACFKACGCGSAIASGSLAIKWVKGKFPDEVQTTKNTDIANELELPPVGIHCSILTRNTVKAAIADYKSRCETK